MLEILSHNPANNVENLDSWRPLIFQKKKEKKKNKTEIYLVKNYEDLNDSVVSLPMRPHRC